MFHLYSLWVQMGRRVQPHQVHPEQKRKREEGHHVVVMTRL